VTLEEPAEPKLKHHASSPRLWVVIHAYFPELLDEIFAKLAAWTFPYSIMLTVPQERYEAACDRIRLNKVSVECLVCENKGRDVLPFLKAARILRDRGAEVILKLHTKKSIHRPDGDTWRADLISKLLDPEVPSRVLADFDADPRLGLVGPAGHVASLTYYWEHNDRTVRRVMESLGVKQLDPEHETFVAGSMFYARLGALRPLLDLPISESDFEPERGQVDGTLAHAIERCFTLVCGSAGYGWTETGPGRAPVVSASLLERRVG
jgi:lipopolysaccharide biosynthesis protein